jgi:hypothetical protein
VGPGHLALAPPVLKATSLATKSERRTSSQRHRRRSTGHGTRWDTPAIAAAPIAFKGRLVQYAGRILRAHPGKSTAEVHDYHDIATGVLGSSLAKRAPGYTSLGFPDPRSVT